MNKDIKLVAACLLLAVSLSSCSLVHKVFGPAYDWNGLRPPKEAQKACNNACDIDGNQKSDRSDAMCHFACLSWQNPWYSKPWEDYKKAMVAKMTVKLKDDCCNSMYGPYFDCNIIPNGYLNPGWPW